MKKIISLLLILLLLLFAASCKNEKPEFVSGEVVYSFEETAFTKPLTSDELSKIKRILNDKKEYEDSDDSCGFSETVAIVLDGTPYMMAKDFCCVLKNGKTGKKINISETDRAYLISIFSQYGGRFPCK